jgi:hypothetical protein
VEIAEALYPDRAAAEVRASAVIARSEYGKSSCPG